MPISEAKKKSDAKWRKKAYQTVSIQLRVGLRDEWKQAADKAGMSFAGYIQQAVKEKMERDNDGCKDDL